jgi:hypothetical protein
LSNVSSSSSEILELDLPGHRYTLSIRTLRQYGLNDAFDRSVSHLLHQVSLSRCCAVGFSYIV